MKKVTVVIPNFNGMKYLEGCLSSLSLQTEQDFETILIDNGSADESVAFVREHFPEVKVRAYHRNTGFCHAVNAGIRLSKTPYVLLLNNDVICDPRMVEALLQVMEEDRKLFSACAKMVQLSDPSKIDDAGDYYCALGWAFARGKGRSADLYQKDENVFSCCAAAAIYRREILDEIGLFDEHHFAYLEDTDIGYRAQICGYRNVYVPEALVLHAGSATSGSRHNSFKVKLSSRNSVYLIRKNMPLWQILLNAPLLTAGFALKLMFFSKKGLGRDYAAGLRNGLRSAASLPAAPQGHFLQYLNIQLQLWKNCIRRVTQN